MAIISNGSSFAILTEPLTLKKYHSSNDFQIRVVAQLNYLSELTIKFCRQSIMCSIHQHTIVLCLPLSFMVDSVVSNTIDTT